MAHAGELAARREPRLVSGFLLVDDAAIRAARRVSPRTRTLAEGTGAAVLAEVLAHRERFANRRVAVVCGGGDAGSREPRALAG
ncbi:threonine dehydratase [Amycolatopsis arida]|uniref:Threonine dehydratase n=1 Tax=Amycolatopsis arida TaxID=587909 RepID=A0A1I5SRV9_9PSEU|nr:hypothetical protein [Amycolatopsis arida]TDX96375.1 hypothetical protein CLV69_103512 [Amycolatopsis arida]SFP73371.1 threonine dehydratase [Amycolatopsis arida]